MFPDRGVLQERGENDALHQQTVLGPVGVWLLPAKLEQRVCRLQLLQGRPTKEVPEGSAGIKRVGGTANGGEVLVEVACDPALHLGVPSLVLGGGLAQLLR